MDYKITITTLNFVTKEDAKERVKFTDYKTVDVSIDEHLSLITKGYAFCSVMKGRRKDVNFQFSNILVYDVDDCTVQMQDYIEKLSIPPTFAYTSSSNGIEGKGCRFRLIYVLDEPIMSLKEYKLLSKSFAVQQEMYSLDTGSYEGGRLWFGNATSNVEVYKSYSVLSKKDILINTEFIEKDKTKTNCTKSATQYYINSPHTLVLTCTFEKDYENLSFQDFIKKYYTVYPNIEHTPIEMNEDEPIVCYPTDYTEIQRPSNFKNGETYKFADGEKRRRKLYINGVVRRKINPDITFENLIYNLVYELEYYYINNGNKITKKDIIEIATNVMKADLDKFKDLGKPKHKFFVNPLYCEKYDISKKEVMGKLRNKKQYIGEFYDISKTDEDNIEIMKEYGLTISLRTLKTWRQENNIKKYNKK